MPKTSHIAALSSRNQYFSSFTSTVLPTCEGQKNGNHCWYNTFLLYWKMTHIQYLVVVQQHKYRGPYKLQFRQIQLYPVTSFSCQQAVLRKCCTTKICFSVQSLVTKILIIFGWISERQLTFCIEHSNSSILEITLEKDVGNQGKPWKYAFAYRFVRAVCCYCSKQGPFTDKTSLLWLIAARKLFFPVCKADTARNVEKLRVPFLTIFHWLCWRDQNTTCIDFCTAWAEIDVKGTFDDDLIAKYSVGYGYSCS